MLGVAGAAPGAEWGVNMDSPSGSFHAEMDGLFNYVRELTPDLAGQCACFAVRKLEGHVALEDCVLVKVRIVSSANVVLEDSLPVHASAGGPRNVKAAVRMTHAQYESLVRHVDEFRIMQCLVTLTEQVYVLDVTSTPSYMAGHVPLQTGEALRVAEIFSGGFFGWSGAGFSLRSFGVPWHTSWYLDADCTCAELLRFLEPDITVVSSASRLAEVAPDPAPVFLAADFRSDWWRNVAALRPTHLACVSPPCQPWSRAGRQSGLDTQDGRLLVQVPGFLGAAGTPVVVVEEVAGLTSHPHFSRVLQAWQRAGYKLAWRRSIQLSEVCPVSRLRLFLIFVHECTCPAAAEQAVDCVWRSLHYPSLEASRVIFRHMPQELLQPCLLSPQLRALYLDERFFPPARGGHSGTRPLNTRVRTPDEQAVCFLASYHAQHELPEDLLTSKGILCSLLADQGDLRFFEIACAHAANLVHFMPSNDRDCMKWLGNSLAVPQSAFVLSLALQYFTPHIPVPDAREVVSRVPGERMDCLNSVFLKVDGGWLLCKRDHLADLLAIRPIRQQIFHAQGSFHVHRREVAFATAEQSHHSLVTLGHIPVDKMPDFLDAHTIQTLMDATPPAVAVADVSFDHDLALAAHSVRQTDATEVIALLAPRFTFCINVRCADAFLNLSAVFTQLLAEEPGVLVCTTVFGDRVLALNELPSLVLLHQVPAAELVPVLQLSCAEVAAVTCVSETMPMVFAVPACVADTWWLGFPAPCLSLLGVAASWDHYPAPESEHAVLTLERGIGPFRLPEDELQV